MQQTEATTTMDMEPEAQASVIDPAKMAMFNAQLDAEQNLPLGVCGGLLAAVLGAAVWAGVTVATGYQIGWMAVGVGFVVGFTVRLLGKGVTLFPFSSVDTILLVPSFSTWSMRTTACRGM